MQTDMTQGNPFSVILKFSLPLLIGNIFQQLYNMCDTIIVGRYVSANALAAVGSTGTIMFMVLGVSTGMGTGFTVLTSQKYGAGDKDGTRWSVANGIILAAMVVVVMTVISVAIMRPLLRVMNTPQDIFEDAYTYIVIICLGTVASVYYNLFSSYMRAVGNSSVPLYFLVFSAVLNVVLDLLLIVVVHMGVAGAALATVLSQGISAVLCLIYIYMKMPDLRPERSHWRLHPTYTSHQLSVGIPMALQNGITASGTMIMQAAINMFGATAVSSFTAACKVQNILTQGMVTIGQTMSAYAGQNYGRMDIERIKKGVWTSVVIMVVYSVIAGALTVALLPNLMQIFFAEGVDIAALMPWAKTYIVECVTCYIPLSLIFILRSTMQGCGYGYEAMAGGIVELVARLVAAFIAMAIGSYALAVGCDPLAWLGAGVFNIFMFRWVLKRIERRGFRVVNDTVPTK